MMVVRYRCDRDDRCSAFPVRACLLATGRDPANAYQIADIVVEIVERRQGVGPSDDLAVRKHV